MKKIIISLAIAIVATGLIFNHQIVNWFTAEKPVNKEINLMIGSGNNYSSKAYESSYASVTITVTKMSGKTETIVWKKSFETLPLSQYPSINKAVANKLIIPGFSDKKEKLIVTYTITYNTRGNILQTVYGEIIQTDGKQGNLAISI